MSSAPFYVDLPPSSADLQQGDILRPTPDLEQILKTVHPHFCDPKYLGFIVITQACDLERRNGKPCKAAYIELAAIRSMAQVLHRYAIDLVGQLAPGVYAEEQMSRVRGLVERILNQNEIGHGLFYLHPNPAVGLGDHALAILRVSVALRGKDHYATLAAARAGRISPDFQSRLGFLLGQLYARPATPDWRDLHSEPLEEAIGRAIADADFTWVKKGHWEAAVKAGLNPGLPKEELVRAIDAHRPPSTRDQAVDVAVEVARQTIPASEQDLDRFRNRLAANPRLGSLLRK